MTRCEKGWHKFKPRYDVVAPKFMERMTRLIGNPEDVYEKRYVCDVCIRCGKTTRRRPV